MQEQLIVELLNELIKKLEEMNDNQMLANLITLRNSGMYRGDELDILTDKIDEFVYKIYDFDNTNVQEFVSDEDKRTR